MKRNILDRLAQIDWGPPRRATLVLSAIIFSIALVATVAIGTQQRSIASPTRASTGVLYIGDSLSVGAFGETLYDHLVSTVGSRNVALYASCGSSPENWLRKEPTFFSRCGYREQTPSGSAAVDSRTHHVTPKVEELLRRYRPTTVIVQLGTNWMDQSLSDERIRSILESFVDSIHAGANCRLVWIGPPDSFRFSKVQGRIYKLIQQSRRRGDIVIDSRRLTHYVLGKTGGDGIHYNRESAVPWATRVIGLLDQVVIRTRTADAGNSGDISAISID
jgi:hypothetical protein